MQLRFRQLLPLPLGEMQHSKQSFWQSGTINLEQGHYYEIIAPSGKGKTSLLDIIFGCRTDYRGEYFIDKQNADKINLHSWAKIREQNISYVFQGLRLFRYLTGWENIMVNNRMTGWLTSGQILNFAYELGIDSQLHKKAGRMSFGQQQRLAIIRALSQPFNWLLLDEPFSHLDDEVSALAAALISKECRRYGAGLIITRLTSDSFIETNEQIVL